MVLIIILSALFGLFVRIVVSLTLDPSPCNASQLYQYLYPMIEAAEDAGAAGCYLSGAGPTVLAFADGRSGDIFVQNQNERKDLAVARAMRESAEKCGIKGKCFVAGVANIGAHVISVSPKFSTEEITYLGGEL